MVVAPLGSGAPDPTQAQMHADTHSASVRHQCGTHGPTSDSAPLEYAVSSSIQIRARPARYFRLDMDISKISP